MNINNFLSFQVHGNAGQGGIVGFVDSFLTFLEGLSGKSMTDIFTELMPGIAAMDNIHPMLVHFPIALITCFFILDFFGTVFKKTHWRDLAGGLLYLGTIFSVLTVIAGFAAEDSVAHGGNVHQIMERHEILGISILSLATLLSIWRWLARGQIKGEINLFYLLLSAVLCVLLALGADLGGLMVYKYGVAVEAVAVDMEEAFKEHTHDHSGHSH